MRLKILHNILKKTHSYKILAVFVVFVLIIAGIVFASEPNITNYGDALWFTCVAMLTIGFGDLVTVTVVGRICTILVALYAALVIALITGIVVSYYTEINSIQKKVFDNLDKSKLTNLENCSKEDLKKISTFFKKIH